MAGKAARFLGYAIRDIGGRNYLIRAEDEGEPEPTLYSTAVFWRADDAEKFRVWLGMVLDYAQEGEKIALARKTKRVDKRATKA